MGKDSELERLEHDMRSDETLAKRLEEAAAAYAGSDAEILAAAAAELGYQVDAAELERFERLPATLDEATALAAQSDFLRAHIPAQVLRAYGVK